MQCYKMRVVFQLGVSDKRFNIKLVIGGSAFIQSWYISRHFIIQLVDLAITVGVGLQLRERLDLDTLFAQLFFQPCIGSGIECRQIKTRFPTLPYIAKATRL